MKENVDLETSTVMTDEYKVYIHLKQIVDHKVVDHNIWYVNGEVHTNTIDGFWSLLKCGIVGQYHKLSVRHLPAYIDEFCYRYSNRDRDDLFAMTIQRGVREIR